ncbi:trigger factor [Riemerella anatipestifer]|uniref:trigger factor n=1 Tax=Riemerella anatipestifer TaxID=34085 RepID=UPI0021087072|nr:trigger factor [Riemerella anatipestifer]MCQ4038851.1 trigger factor [Riemerella anatipestifer]MCT6772868.1 trigger factor [Riemerella anatipestifer]MCU7575983.1 trigger factor [Riemerella anatipestifer]MDR7714251.1 trigger factor [Riemerella anatipestifer]MDR7756049.1 trigger factor [Riemerella anatipestifer]
MKVTSKNHDEVSALLTVTLDKKDYKDKVEKQLINYAKNATIPGFRKGKAPLGMIKRQYEAGLTYEEINKQVSEGLNNYINENKLRLLGQPVPVPVEELDTNQEQLELSFEVGFEPDFNIDLAKYEAPHYKIEASDKEVGQSIENMQKRFAEREAQEKVTKDSYISLEVSQVAEEDEEGEHNHAPKHVVINTENKAAFELVKKLKKDESVKVSKEDLTKDEDLAKFLGFAKEEAEQLHHNEVEVTVKDIYKLNLAELNQELFDSVYGKDTVKSEEELKAKVKSELDEYFQQNADVHFVNKVLEQITEKEEVKLPEAFLIKWLMFSNPNIATEEQAKEIFEAEKNQIKYQVIEGKLMSDNDVKIDYADVLAQAEQLVRNQLAIYGIHHLSDEEVQKYAVEMLKNQEQVRQISSEVAMAKLKDVILEKASKKESKISHDDFLKEVQG